MTGPQLDCIKGSILTLTLFLAYIALPLIGMAPGLIAPLPAMFYTVKSGRIVGVLIILISTVVLALLTEAATTVLFLLQCGFMALAIPNLLLRGKATVQAITYTVALNFGIILLLAALYSLSQGVDLHSQVLKGVNASITHTAQLYQKSGISGDDLKNLQDGLQQAGVLIGRIYPALLLLSLGFIASLNVALLARFCSRLPNPLLLGDFNQFRNPEQLVWVLIVAGFTLLVENAEIKAAALNLLVVTLCIYFVQGLAVIGHFFKRLNVSTLMRGLFYLIIMLQPYLLVVVALLGIFDLWGDFRTPKKQENL